MSKLGIRLLSLHLLLGYGPEGISDHRAPRQREQHSSK